MKKLYLQCLDIDELSSDDFKELVSSIDKFESISLKADHSEGARSRRMRIGLDPSDEPTEPQVELVFRATVSAKKWKIFWDNVTKGEMN